MNRGQFKPGNVPYNKGVHKPTSEKCLETCFKIGNVPKTAKPPGSITKRVDKTGNWYNIINVCPVTGKRKPNMPYSRYVMAKHIGRMLSSSEIVYHTDGNTLNDDISNLVIITRRELLALNRKTDQ